MSKLLLPVDDNEERARRQARTIESLPFASDDLSVTILHVFSDNPEGASVGQFRPARAAERILSNAGFETQLEEQSGDPAETIIEFAESIDADLICVAGRKRSPAGKVLFGSVSQNVILGTERPVLVGGTIPESG